MPILSPSAIEDIPTGLVLSANTISNLHRRPNQRTLIYWLNAGHLPAHRLGAVWVIEVRDWLRFVSNWPQRSAVPRLTDAYINKLYDTATHIGESATTPQVEVSV